MSHNNQKKIAVINDFSGFGRCSVAVELPIISALKIQCCVVPTSIFSNHSGYEDFYFDDYTEKMNNYIEQWKKLDLRFEGIATGFLGSVTQIEIVSDFIKEFKSEDTQVVIDPVIGDDGVAYSTYTDEMCREMKRLVSYANIITPNLTEACMLTDTEYKDTMSREEIEKMLEKLSKLGPDKIVITGLKQGKYLTDAIYENHHKIHFLKNPKIGQERAGTGDIFAAIIAADAVNGVGFKQSVMRATEFIRKCIERSIELDIPQEDGLCFEEYLTTLR